MNGETKNKADETFNPVFMRHLRELFVHNRSRGERGCSPPLGNLQINLKQHQITHLEEAKKRFNFTPFAIFYVPITFDVYNRNRKSFHRKTEFESFSTFSPYS